MVNHMARDDHHAGKGDHEQGQEPVDEQAHVANDTA
jgi:hypothetical protein